MLRGAVSWEGLFKLIFKFLKSCNLFFFFWVGVWIPKRGQRGFLSTAKSFKMVVLFFFSYISLGEG